MPSCYRPQRSCGQGYVFTRVCDSVHRGVCLSACWDAPPRSKPPSGGDPPGGDTPPLEETPPGGDTPALEETPPGGDTPPGADPPGADPPSGGDPPGGDTSPAGDTPLEETPPWHTVNERPVRILLECILV